jgi:hypothetical protein
MNGEHEINAYLIALRRRLGLCPGNEQDVLDEVGDHLREARDAAMRGGMAKSEAEKQAIAAFGDAALIARRFTMQRSWRRALRLLPVALALGAGMAWIDSRPTWDDTGVSAVAVFAVSGALALLEPTRPWLWALVIGGWFPAISIATSGNWGAFMALGFSCIGAFAGSWTRRAAAAQA